MTEKSLKERAREYAESWAPDNTEARDYKITKAFITVAQESAMWGLLQGEEKLHEMWERHTASEMALIKERDALRAALDEQAEAYVEYFARLVESLPASARRKAEVAILMRAREIRKKEREASKVAQ